MRKGGNEEVACVVVGDSLWSPGGKCSPDSSPRVTSAASPQPCHITEPSQFIRPLSDQEEITSPPERGETGGK